MNLALHSRGDGRAEIVGTSPVISDDGLRTGACFERDGCLSYAVEGNFNRDEGTGALWFRPDWNAENSFADGLGKIIWDLRVEHGSVVENDPSQRWALVYPDPGARGKGFRPDSTFGCWR